MKNILFILVVCVAGSSSLVAETGVAVLVSDDLPREWIGGKSDYKEGWNEEIPFSPGATYINNCYAFIFSPGSSYLLSRIEFMGGGIPGPCRIEIRSDTGTGYPDGGVLGGGNFDLVAEVGWQGIDLDPPVAVVEGTDYHIVYQVVIGSYGTLADPDDAPPGTVFDMIPFYLSENCGVWDGPHVFWYWMARFFESGQVAETTSTWGSVKAMYR